MHQHANFVVLPRKQSVNFCSNNNNKLKRKERKPWRRGLFSLDLNTVTESPLRTVCGSEFQTAGAEHQQVEGVLCKCHHHGWLSQRGSGQLQVVAVLSVLDHADTRKRGGGTRRLRKQLGIRR